MKRTSAIQKLKLAASVGIGPYVLLSRWTTQGAVPWRSWSTNERQVVIISSFVVTRGRRGRPGIGDAPAPLPLGNEPRANEDSGLRCVGNAGSELAGEAPMPVDAVNHAGRPEPADELALEGDGRDGAGAGGIASGSASSSG
jgi:hypothetical protein